jgi:Effector-associated domain 1
LDARESQLCRALLDAYPTRDEFAEVLFDIEKNLDAIVTSQLNLVLTVKRVVRTARRQGWLADFERAAMEGNPGNRALLAWYDAYCARLVALPQVAAPVSAPPEWRQFEPMYFDLKPIRAALLQAIMMPSGPVLGFGVTYGDFAYIDKLQDIVIGHLAGETQRHQPLSLKPEHGRVSSKVERVRRHIDDLASANVLRVVYVDAAPAADFAEFWQQMCQMLRGSSRHLVLLFVGDAGTTFPLGATVLPPPRFDRDDLTLWAADTVRQIKWPVALAPAWTDLLCAGAGDGPDLDIGMIYEAMDKSIKEIRYDAESFRRKLENRMVP